MSFITPTEYQEISEKLGDAFSKIRNAINDPDGTADAKNDIEDALVFITDSTDNDSRVSETIDPIGSIMGDLGSTWSSTVANNFSTTRASSIAAGLFSSAFRKLNNHVKDRTLDQELDPPAKHRTIQSWYDTYGFIEGDAENSLFSSDGSTIDNSLYFSQEFVDLSSALNVTIPNQYRRSTYE